MPIDLFPGNTKIGCLIKPVIAISIYVIGLLIYKYDLEKTNDIIGLLTPFVLLGWFFYSQRQTLQKEFNEELKGAYHGLFWDREFEGIKINILQVDLQGEFVGELIYIRNKAERYTYVIYGHIHYIVMLNKKDEVRKYGGEFSIVERRYHRNMNQTPDEQNVLIGRYQIVFHREVQSLAIIESRKSSILSFPNYFFIYKEMKLNNKTDKEMNKLFHDEMYENKKTT